MVVGTGGYAAGMMLAYSVVHGIPIVQQAGDSRPGLTARMFSHWSQEIYLNFPGGKAELVAAATRAAGDEMTTMMRDYVAQPDPVGAFTRMWSEILVSTDFEGGCPIVAAAAGDGSEWDGEFGGCCHCASRGKGGGAVISCRGL